MRLARACCDHWLPPCPGRAQVDRLSLLSAETLVKCLRTQLMGYVGHDVWGAVTTADDVDQIDELLERQGMLWVCTFKSPGTLLLGGCVFKGGTLPNEQISVFVWYIVTVELRCVLMAHLSHTAVTGARVYSNVTVHL